MKGKIFVTSGPSGSGKSTLLQRLFARKNIKGNLLRIRTVTTRRPRKGEKRGIDYRFLTKKEFLKLKTKGYFLESKKYLGDFYGTPKMFLQQAKAKKKQPLLCIDVEGALKVRKKFKKNSVLIFIKPPGPKALQARLKKRKTESSQILKKRLRIAQKEVKYAKKYDYCIVNEKVKQTVDLLENIILAEISQVG